MKYFACYESPFGPLQLVGDGTFLLELNFSNQLKRREEMQEAPEMFVEVRAQLDEYFSGRRRGFELPLRLVGSPFQIRAWEALKTIPYGKTISYKEQAARIGSHPRAVGLANGQNPIPIIVPCHRVIGANGQLVGFGGGLEMKRTLLNLETTSHYELTSS